MERRVKASSESTAFLVMIAVALVLLNVLSAFFYGRWDLTERRLHSLSGGTKRLLQNLDDRLTVRAYFSDNLPPPFNSHEQAVRDLLDEYEAYGRGKLHVEIIHPEGNDDLEKQARDDGIEKVPHAALQQDEAREMLGYRGVVFAYRGETKSIPVLSRSADISGLEYDFTTNIRQVLGDKRTIGFVTGHGEPTVSPPPPRQNPMEPEQDPGISYLHKLVKNYNLRAVNLKTAELDPQEMRGLMVVGPTKNFPEEDLYALDQYIMRGGAVAFFVNGTKVEDGMGGVNASAMTTGLEPLLETYGVTLAQDVVMDTQTDQFLVVGQVRTPMGNIPMSIPRPYPAWPHLAADQIAEDHPLLFRLPGLTLLWPSTVRITSEAAEADNIETQVLARTTERAWNATENFVLDPRQEEDDWMEQRERAARKGRFPLIVQLSGTFPSHFAESGPPTGAGTVLNGADQDHLTEGQNPARILVVGDADLFNIQYVGSQRRPRHAPSNLTFLMNSLDWLAEDEDLIEVRAKRLEDPSLPELSDSKRNWIKWGNILAWPLLFLLFGVLRWSLRRRQREELEQNWSKGGGKS